MAFDEGLAARIRGALTIVVALGLWSSALVAGADEAAPRHLIYLHGRIVQEQQSARPRHPEFGYYELEAILAAFRERGFVVTGGIRPKGETPSASADRIVGQIRSLLASGVPASRITVVGASMGAWIALLTSARLQEPAVRFCVLGACLSQSVPLLVAEHGQKPAGRFSRDERRDERAVPGLERRRGRPRDARRARDRAQHRAAPRLPVPSAARVGRALPGVGRVALIRRAA
jgi:pimeloyl-ACP methyl ester carboxylesterase